MTLSIVIEPEVEARLRRRAADAGQDVDAYASGLLSKALAAEANEESSEDGGGPSIARQLQAELHEAWQVTKDLTPPPLQGQDALAQQLVRGRKDPRVFHT